jgi:predicted kinase
MNPTDTPETDDQTRHAWTWDAIRMDYRPAGIVVDADLARKLERERNAAIAELEYIANAGLSARHLERSAREFLADRNNEKARPG